jgi:hypothetical protein
MAILAEWAALKCDARKDELYEAQIQELSKRQDTHSLDTDKFVRSLKDKPKAKRQSGTCVMTPNPTH